MWRTTAGRRHAVAGRRAGRKRSRVSVLWTWCTFAAACRSDVAARLPRCCSEVGARTEIVTYPARFLSAELSRVPRYRRDSSAAVRRAADTMSIRAKRGRTSAANADAVRPRVGRSVRSAAAQKVNLPTVVRRSAAIRDSSSTAVRVWVSAWVVESAAGGDAGDVRRRSRPCRRRPRCTDRDISLVVAVCSSTAEAIVVCRSEICATIEEISSIAVDRRRGVALDRRHPPGDVLGRLRRLLRELLDLVGDDREALAGLTGPRGLDGGVERQQVRLLGDLVITLTTLPISAEDSPSLATVAVVVSAAVTARAATSLASAAFDAISRIEAPICSAPAATVCTLRDTSSAAEATTPDWAEVSSRRGRDLRRRGRQLLRATPRPRPPRPPPWRGPPAGSPAPRPATRPCGRPRRLGRSRWRGSGRPRPASRATRASAAAGA